MDERMNERVAALLHEAKQGAAAAWVETMADAESEIAFLLRYGTSEELGTLCRRLGGVLRWWRNRGPHPLPRDSEAIGALERAHERLEQLVTRAEWIEQDLRHRWGYEFDADTRRIKRCKQPGERGPRKNLLSERVVRCFDQMTEKEGWPRSNTLEAREEIAFRLMGKVHPDELDTGKGSIIHSAVNAALHDERHY